MHNLRLLSLSNAVDLRAELSQIAPQVVTDENLAKAQFHIFKLERASTAMARFLYQELVMEGGHVVMKPGLVHGEEGETDVLLMGTLYQLRRFASRLRTQHDDELQHLASDMEKRLQVA